MPIHDLYAWLETFTWSSISAAIIVLSVTLLHFIFEPLRWKICYLPAHSTKHRVSCVRDALYCTALAAYLLPFKLGIPLRVALLHSRANLDLHVVAVLLALDGLLSILAWSALTAASVWIAALHWRPPELAWVLCVAGMIMFGAIAVAQPQLRGRWLRRWREALAVLDRSGRRVGIATGILVGDITSYGVRHALLVFLVTGEADKMLIGGAIGIVSTFAGIVSGLPMGLVGYDATLIALLTASGLPVSQSIWIAVTNRLLNVGSALVLGLPAAYRLRLGFGIVQIFRRLWGIAHGRK